MERIDSYGSTYFRSRDTNNQKPHSKKTKKSVFRSLLSSVRSEQNDVEAFEALDIEDQELLLEETLDDIHEVGERLKRNPTMELIKQYKQAVRGFLKFIVDHSMAVEKTELSGFKVLKTNGQKELTLIKIIDAKLEKLAAGVFQNQKNQFNFLSKVDEIYGILVDLIH